jgi:hypothetical protein
MLSFQSFRPQLPDQPESDTGHQHSQKRKPTHGTIPFSSLVKLLAVVFSEIGPIGRQVGGTTIHAIESFIEALPYPSEFAQAYSNAGGVPECLSMIT